MSDFEYSVQTRAKEMLDHFATLNKRTQLERKLAAKPEVGVLLMYDSHLWVDATEVDQAPQHGDFKGQESCHDAFWRQLQVARSVPYDMEYDEVPRGRVGYNVKNRTFYLFLDKCILENERMVDKIFSIMHLPSKDTKIERDSHYICPGCKKKSKKQLQKEEEDWNFLI
jgi:hypothetical protein